jgi:hypothetical protein
MNWENEKGRKPRAHERANHHHVPKTPRMLFEIILVLTILDSDSRILSSPNNPIPYHDLILHLSGFAKPAECTTGSKA